MQSNITKYYVYNFFYLFAIFEGILFVYFQNGLNFTLTQIMFTVALFTILTALLEIPTGVVGDKLGYKKTMLLGSVGILMGSIGYALARSFYQILLVEIIWAFGFALNSGTQDSFLYDTLKNLKREKEFNKINGRATAIFWTGLATATIIGSFLAGIELKLPVSAGFIPLLIPLFIVLSFKEPRRKLKKSSHLEHAIGSFKDVLSNTKLKFIVFYIVLIFLVLESTYKFFQPFMNSMGLQIQYFGLVFSFGYMISSIGALISHKLASRLGEKRMLYLIYLATFCTLLFIGVNYTLYGIIGLLILLILDGIQGPAMTDYLNRLVKSHNRATVNSISNLIRTTALAILLPILGYVGDVFSIRVVFLLNALIIGVGFILIRLLYKKI